MTALGLARGISAGRRRDNHQQLMCLTTLVHWSEVPSILLSMVWVKDSGGASEIAAGPQHSAPPTGPTVSLAPGPRAGAPPGGPGQGAAPGRRARSLAAHPSPPIAAVDFVRTSADTDICIHSKHSSQVDPIIAESDPGPTVTELEPGMGRGPRH